MYIAEKNLPHSNSGKIIPYICRIALLSRKKKKFIKKCINKKLPPCKTEMLFNGMAEQKSRKTGAGQVGETNTLVPDAGRTFFDTVCSVRYDKTR